MLKRIALVFVILSVLGAGWFYWSVSSRTADWTTPGASAPAMAAATREPCRHHDPLRQAFFGDLHVHSSYSFDASSRDMRGTPDDAYRFAKGERVGLSPYDENGVGTQPAQLTTPLDFAAVTDHSERMGEVNLCRTPGSLAYDSESCRAFRGEGEDGEKDTSFWASFGRMTALGRLGGRAPDICGPGNQWCRDALETTWQANQAAAERHYDRSSECRFTTFHGYEYSLERFVSMLHRNIIFRNEVVPEIPISAQEEPDAMRMLERIRAFCNESGGDCEAVSIPHNSNASSGRMFTVSYRGEPMAEQVRLASLRARMEPLLEIMQVKGESECRSGMWNVVGEDELCDFEKARGLGENAPTSCTDDEVSYGGTGNAGCQSRLDFGRYALVEGMVEAERIGVNPYRLGFIGSTDTHVANPGDTEEDNFTGCCGSVDDSPEKRLDPSPGWQRRPIAGRNPGGLMGAWAEENSRDSLFDAMQRREVFGTSGTRIRPRFFAGHDLPEDICDRDLAVDGYKGGVPMGGTLVSESGDDSPLFVATALADPNGGLLQRLQIIKVWHEGDDRFHQEIFDIAGDATNGASVDLSNCVPRGKGATNFCTTWRDPNFDPDRSAAYYTRVIENPSCRYHVYDCLQFSPEARPEVCNDPQFPKIIQERAWTSPIWSGSSSEVQS